MLYRIFHWINRWYALSLLWLFIGTFALAAAMMFIFPQITLLLLFLGLAGLGLAVVGSRILHAIEHRLARRSLHMGICPRCGGAGQASASSENDDWRCEYCGCAYAPSGAELTPEVLDQQESSASSMD